MCEVYIYPKNNNLYAVEFLGIPGSGKTYLSREVAKDLIVRGYKVFEITERIANLTDFQRFIIKLSYVSYELLLHLRLSMRMIMVLSRVRYKKFWRLFKVGFNWFFLASITRRMLRSKDHCLYLLDQGIFQAIWSINFEVKNIKYKDDFNRAILKLYSWLFSRPMVVIVINVKDDTLIRRLRDRKFGHSPLDRYLFPDLLNAQNALDTVKALAFSIIANHPGLSIISVNNNNKDELRKAVQQIYEHISR